MDVLVVASHVPHAGVRHAGGVFLLQHLRLLAEQGRVTVLVGGEVDLDHEPAEPPEHEVVLAPLRPPPRWSRARQINRLHRQLWPGQIGPTARAALLQAGLVERAHAADVVEIHWSDLAVLAPLLRAHGVRTPIAVVEHDVDAQAAASRARVQTSPPGRLRHALLRHERGRQERRHLNAADVVLVFKQEDAQLLRRLGVHTPTVVVDPWLDEPATEPVVERVPRSVLFTGALWREENARAVLWFLEQVWPRVRTVVPGARFLLVGAGPTPEVLAAAARQPGVDVTGEVPDLDPYYRRACVFVAPLLVAGGLKFKVPQAMLYGLPVVATSTAADGVVQESPPGTFWAVADDPDALATALTRALADPVAADAVGARAAEWCRARYAFPASHARVLARYAALAGAADQAPMGEQP